MGYLWYAQRHGSLHLPQRLVQSLVTTQTIGGTFYCHDVVTAQHRGRTAQRRYAIEQLIVCDRNNSITAAYFDAQFAQGESQGNEKWH